MKLTEAVEEIRWAHERGLIREMDFIGLRGLYGSSRVWLYWGVLHLIQMQALAELRQ